MKLFIGIPTIRRYEPFWESIANFIMKASCEGHEVETCKIEGQPLAQARNTIVSRFLQSDKTHLLFVDDDHNGHSIDMLNALIKADEYMVGIKCYARNFPYLSNILEYSNVDYMSMGLQEDQGKYRPIDNTSGYVNCDLVGFGMTLLKREVFSKILEPYFVSKDNTKEDNYFCDKLVKAGIKPVGCCEFVLEHNGIGEHNAMQLRDEGIRELLRINPNMKVLVS